MRPSKAPADAPRQGGLDLPSAPLSWETLVRGAENEAALILAERPALWALPALCVTGPARCGLTTLASLVAKRHGGQCFAALELVNLTNADLALTSQSFASIDDADRVADRAPEALLSLLNLSAARGGYLLLTAHRPPSRWPTRSADLRSRLNAMPVVEIYPPGEALAHKWLAAIAAQQYMRLSPETLNYLVPRLDLHYEAAEQMIRHLSEAVTASGRAPGISLARRVLEGIEDAGDDSFPGATGGG